jgi:uncharacterized oligopeptide transporter (OPT) family protein
MDLAHQGVVGYVRAFPVNAQGNFNPVRWALWGGTAVMVFSSLASVALQWRTLRRAFTVVRTGEKLGRADALARIEVPVSWLIAGLVPLTIGMVIVQHVAFQVSIPLGLIAVALTAVVALVSCRATGETDTTPAGAMGKLTQMLYAVLPGARGDAAINLMAAGTTGSAGMAAADLLTDLKSGYVLGANPRKQFLAQFIGVFFGTVAIIPAWYAMVPHRKALEAFNPPVANMWKAVADLLTQGVRFLPESALWAIVLGALVGVALPVAERLWPSARRYLPSAMGLGLSWVMPFQNSLSLALGALLALVWSRLHKQAAETFTIPTAAGFVAGESLIAAIIAIACTVASLLALRP